MAKTLPYTCTVNTDGYQLNPNDTIHYSTQGMVDLGTGFGEAYLWIVPPRSPCSSPVRLVEVSLGFESGHPQVLRELNKRFQSEEVRLAGARRLTTRRPRRGQPATISPGSCTTIPPISKSCVPARPWRIAWVFRLPRSPSLGFCPSPR